MKTTFEYAILYIAISFGNNAKFWEIASGFFKYIRTMVKAIAERDTDLFLFFAIKTATTALGNTVTL